MKLIIELPKKIYKWIKEHQGVTDFQTTKKLYESIINAVPLEDIKPDGKTMKLIIELPEDIYNYVKTENSFNGYDICKVKDSIKNGTPWEDVKVEIQNTILEQTYEKGYHQGYYDALEKIKEEIENIDLLQDRAYEQSWSEKHSKSPLDIKKEALSILDNHIKEDKDGKRRSNRITR